MYYLLLHFTYVENLIKIFFMWVYLFSKFLFDFEYHSERER
jgi:hypothetical protein